MFEETLKGMIQEARQMVKREDTKSGDEVQGKTVVSLLVPQKIMVRSNTNFIILHPYLRCMRKAIWSCR